MSGLGGMGSSRRSSRYNTTGSGYSTPSASSSSRRGRSMNYGNTSAVGGVVPQSAPGQGTDPRQTQSTGSSANRKTAAAKTGPAGSATPSSAPGGIQVQGSSNIDVQARVPGNPALPVRPGQPQRGKPAPPKKDEVKTRPTATFYVDTPNASLVVEQPFTVSVALSNSGKLEYDTLAFALYFDPADLMPVSGVDEAGQRTPLTALAFTASPPEPAAGNGGEPDVSDETDSVQPAERTSGEEKSGSFIAKNQERYKIIQNEVDGKKGLIRFKAEVVGQPAKDSGLVVQIPFKPLRVSSTSISFVFSDPYDSGSAEEGNWTALSLKGADQLGSRYMESDGVVNLNLNIYETLEKARQKPIVKDVKGQSLESSEEDLYATQIILIPRQETIDVGDVVDVDVVLENPGAELIDSVSLLAAYNPRVFEAVDLDDFSPGVNLSDEEYRSEFPFDFPMINHIDTEKGLIEYRKKTMKKPVRAEGIFATFRLRAIRPTTKTTFRVFLNEKGEEPTTGVFYRFQDRLGDPGDPFDGVTTCSLSVRPTTAYLNKMVK